MFRFLGGFSAIEEGNCIAVNGPDSTQWRPYGTPLI
jgi:hypothetical protein